MHRTILVAATPDEAGRDALALGVELARPLGAQLVLASVEAAHGARAWAGEDEGALYELRAMANGAPGDIPVSVERTEAGSLMQGLHDLAIGHDASLLVLGPSHRTAFDRAVRGDVAADAVSAVPCAVAVAISHQDIRAPRTIGVAWDATEEADEALEWAIQLAERTAGRLRILRVLNASHPEGTRPNATLEAEVERVRAAVSERVPAESKVLWGDPGPALGEAGRGLDLLVLGSRARGRVRRALFGSVSEAAIHAGHCPVLVLPRGVHAPPPAVAA